MRDEYEGAGRAEFERPEFEGAGSGGKEIEGAGKPLGSSQYD